MVSLAQNMFFCAVAISDACATGLFIVVVFAFMLAFMT